MRNARGGIDQLRVEKSRNGVNPESLPTVHEKSSFCDGAYVGSGNVDLIRLSEIVQGKVKKSISDGDLHAFAIWFYVHGAEIRLERKNVIARSYHSHLNAVSGFFVKRGGSSRRRKRKDFLSAGKGYADFGKRILLRLCVATRNARDYEQRAESRENDYEEKFFHAPQYMELVRTDKGWLEGTILFYE